MTTTVLVIGAGYAGVTAANRIAAAQAGEVTVLDPRDEFVERIRLHRLAAGSGAATVPLRRVLDPRARTRPARVTAIGDGAVTLDGGDLLRFDRLVYAVGSGGGPAPGDGHRVDTLEGATRLHDAVAALPDGRVVAVVGGLIVGAGDAVVAPPEVGFVRASCQAAIPLGTAAARTVTTGIAGRRAPAASVAYQAQCLALGPGAAVVQLVDSRDRPRRLAVGGRAGALVKEQVCRYTLRAVRGRAA